MCGIIGIGMLGSLPKEQEITRQAVARYLMTEMLLRTQKRGEDATGLALIFNDGFHCGLKMGVDATEFLFRKGEKETDYRNFMRMWGKLAERKPEGKFVRIALGHCRKSTGGSVTDNNNNHPIFIDPIIGVHNGVIKNDYVIFNKLGCKRDGLVDSEAIFRLLHKETHEGKVPFTSEIILDVANKLEGQYAVIAANSNNPQQIAVFRDGRPMECCLIKPLNILLIGSETEFIDMSLFRLKLHAGVLDPIFNYGLEWPVIEKADIETKMLPDDNLAIISLGQQLETHTSIHTLIKTHSIPRTGKQWTKITTEETTPVVYNRTAGATKHPTLPAVPASSTNLKGSSSDDEQIEGLIYIKALKDYKSIESTAVSNTVGTVDDLDITEIPDAVVVENEAPASPDIPLFFKVSDDKTYYDKGKAKIREVDLGIKSNNKVIYLPSGPCADPDADDDDVLRNIGMDLERIVDEALKDESTNPDQTNETKQLSRVVVDVGKDISGIEEASNYATSIECFDTLAEIAAALDIVDAKTFQDAPLIAIINKARKRFSHQAFYDGYIKGKQTAALTTSAESEEAEKDAERKEDKQTQLIKTAKTVIRALTEAINRFQKREEVGSIEDFVTSTASKLENFSVEDLKPLFNGKDYTNNALVIFFNSVPRERKIKGQVK